MIAEIEWERCFIFQGIGFTGDYFVLGSLVFLLALCFEGCGEGHHNHCVLSLA